ncbi:transcriptional regulator, AraC family [Rhizobium sp. RU35A]|uniref:Helix-turn-helix transcriptional regulator n=1 Tax=Rhizobium straminoryzae TaxID=1387186 RepID=A0A549T7G7_9HYPH|nr:MULTISPECIES: AraC family transcriptional regulator [Rhizobium]TRL37814.1 helix-turn-helix transcriptional regulator [Rhizobium straminoryzae]SIQ94812.1 transcriptional regulator, AraC family [Rhizobium sp. RU35A]
MGRNENSDFIREADDRQVFAAELRRGRFSAARVSVGVSAAERLTDPHALEDAFLITYQNRDYEGDLWVDGKPLPTAYMPQGSFTFYDYRRQWQANLRSAFDCLNFHVPRALINGLLEEDDGRPVDTLVLSPGEIVHDATLTALSEAMQAAVQAGQTVSPLLLDQISLAFCSHVAASYGNRSQPQIVAGRLAPWQERVALEFLAASDDDNLSIKAAAEHCRLSQTYFVRAFRRSFNMTPHQWLMQRRMKIARDLLKTTLLPVSEVAKRSGFSDPAYFSRLFQARVGLSPTQFRRRLRG